MAEAAQGYTDWIDPSKIGPPNWSLFENIFQQWFARSGSSQDTVQYLGAFLRSRDWLSVELRVNADGRKTCRRLTADFYRDIAWLEAVPDADPIDHLEIHYPDGVDPSSLFDWHTSFWGRTAEFERELERLYPTILYPTTAAPPSTAVAPAVSEVATQDVSCEAQGIDADGRPTANPSTVTTVRKGRGSRQQRMVQQIAAEEFPDGYDQIETGVIIHTVSNRLGRQKLPVPKRDVFLRALGRRKD
jgi:hypothetical protein